MIILRSPDSKLLCNAAGKLLCTDQYRGAFVFTVTVPAGQTFTLPLVSGAYSYDFWVDWGDGSEGYVNAYNSPYASHTYTNAGTYTVRLGGKCQGFSVNNYSQRQYITKILSWGYCDFRKFDLYGAYITEVPMTAITGMNNITSFVNFMRGTGLYAGTLSDQWFTQTPNVTNFQYAFSGCSATGNIPEYIFWNTTKVTDFSMCFYFCYSLTGGLTGNLFKNCPEVLYFTRTFAEMPNLNQALPEDLFWGNPNVLSFSLLFEKAYKLHGSIPEKLFWYNTKVTDFSYCFYFGGSSGTNFTGTIPANLFQNCTEVISFNYLFRWSLGIGKAPNGLFRNNLKATQFVSAFETCQNMEVEQYVFSAPDPNIPGDTNEAAAYRRFAGKNMQFQKTFALNNYIKPAGTRYAPELWDSTKYNMASAANYSQCFYRNTAYTVEPYVNQASIPVGWK